jgi:hypothetical protein
VVPAPNEDRSARDDMTYATRTTSLLGPPMLVAAVATAGLAGVVRQGPAGALAVAIAVEVAGAWFGGDHARIRHLTHALAVVTLAVGAPLALTGYQVTDCLWTAALAYLCIGAAHVLDTRAAASLAWLTLAGATGCGVVLGGEARIFTGGLAALSVVALLDRRATWAALQPVAALAVVSTIVTIEREAAPVPALLAMAALSLPALLATLNWSRRWWDPTRTYRSIVDRLDGEGWPPDAARRALLVPTFVGGVGAVLVADDTVPTLIAAGVMLLTFALALVVTFDTRQGRPLPRRILALGVGVVGGLMAAGALAGLPAAREMRDASELARQGIEIARGGELSEALGSLDAARAQFARAQSNLSSPLGIVGRMVPGVGASLRAADDLAGVGVDLSLRAQGAAVLLTEDGLPLERGQVPLDKIEQLSDDLTAVDAAIDRALAITAQELQSPWLRPAEREVRKARVQLADLAETTEVGHRVTQVVPALFGSDRPHRYLVAVVTPSELRGSGGLLGSFGELRASRGRVTIGRVDRIERLNELSDPVEQEQAIDREVDTAYAQFDLARFWQNRTAPADFTLAAEAMEAGYEIVTGVKVDGTIQVTPVALARMLAEVGSIEVSGWPEPITAENAERVLLVEQYVSLDGEDREQFLAEVALTAFERFTRMNLTSLASLIDRLAPAAASGHLRLHFADPAAQALVASLGLDGALPDPATGDALTLVTQNASSSKIDSFLRRSVAYDVVWDAETGAISGEATVRLRNTAPSDGLPPYVIGGLGASPVSPGTNRMYVSLHSPVPVERVLTTDGTELPITRAELGGVPISTVFVSVPPRGSLELKFVLAGTLAPGPYRLAVGLQPTVAPDQLELAVRDPAGRLVPLREHADPDGRVDVELERAQVFTTG